MLMPRDEIIADIGAQIRKGGGGTKGGGWGLSAGRRAIGPSGQ